MGTTEPSGLCIRPLWPDHKLCDYRKQCRSRLFADSTRQPDSFVVVLGCSIVLLCHKFDTVRDGTNQKL